MNAPALSSVDPRTLSSSQRRALRLLASGAVLHRRPNGFGRPGTSVALDVAKSLVGLGLAAMPPGKPLGLSYNGKLMAAIIESRARGGQPTQRTRP